MKTLITFIILQELAAALLCTLVIAVIFSSIIPDENWLAPMIGILLGILFPSRALFKIGLLNHNKPVDKR